MQAYHFEGTDTFPTIIFDQDKGTFLLKGRSTPENGKEFFEPALDWLTRYSKAPNASTEFVFDLDYFNISSSKIILFMLYKLLEIQNSGKSVKVIWTYSDAYLLGAGRDYAYMVKVPFEFKKVSKREKLSKDIAA